MPVLLRRARFAGASFPTRVETAAEKTVQEVAAMVLAVTNREAMKAVPVAVAAMLAAAALADPTAAVAAIFPAIPTEAVARAKVVTVQGTKTHPNRNPPSAGSSNHARPAK